MGAKKNKSLEIKKNKKGNKNYVMGLIAVTTFIIAFYLHFNNFKDLTQPFNSLEKTDLLKFIKIRCIKIGVLSMMMFILLYVIKKIGIGGWKWYLISFFIWIFQFFYFLEIYLSILPPSQGNGQAFVSKLWFSKYWETNIFGYRDRQFDLNSISKEKIILFVGDSFVAGHGLKKTSQRTPNILEQLLNNNFFLINGGRNGIGTRDEFKIIHNFPIKPKLIVLCHVPNDINDVLPKEVRLDNNNNFKTTKFSDFIIKQSKNSLFGDLMFIFTKGFEFNEAKPKPENGGEIKYEYQHYKNKEFLSHHLEDLDKIANYVIDSLKTKLLIITYPESNKHAIDSSNIYINKKIIGKFQNKENIYILNTTDIFKKVKEKDRIVNVFDGHPSVEMNKLVAASIYRFLNDNEILDKK